MGSTSERLKELRPVTFQLKTDPHGALRYGLIAEEVVKPDRHSLDGSRTIGRSVVNFFLIGALALARTGFAQVSSTNDISDHKQKYRNGNGRRLAGRPR